MKMRQILVALWLLSFLSMAAHVGAQTERAVWPASARIRARRESTVIHQIHCLSLCFQNGVELLCLYCYPS